MNYLVIERARGNVELFTHLKSRFAWETYDDNLDDGYDKNDHCSIAYDSDDSEDDFSDDDDNNDNKWQNVRCRRSVMIIPNCLRCGQWTISLHCKADSRI